MLRTSRGLITFRPAQESDAQTFRDLRLEALRNHPVAYSSDFAAYAERPLHFWLDRLRSLGENDAIFFALHGETLIGMCGIYRERSPKTQHYATVYAVYVQPGWRGLGIADGLIGQCLEWGKNRGVKFAKLGVAITNTAAIRCYTRCGFRMYGIEPQVIYHDGIYYDEFLMVKELDA
jgi:ribosomal protein S18 acetylase RimI-like enzyme